MQGVALLIQLHCPFETPHSKYRSSNSANSDQQEDGPLQVNRHHHILAVFWGELHLICISSSFFFSPQIICIY